MFFCTNYQIVVFLGIYSLLHTLLKKEKIDQKFSGLKKNVEKKKATYNLHMKFIGPTLKVNKEIIFKLI